MGVEQNGDPPLSSEARSTVDRYADQASESGGYLVGELPVLLKSGKYLAVVNNKKCVLYSCKQGQKVAECLEHDDMIVSCDSFEYSKDTDLLFTASSDGILKICALVPRQGVEIELVLLGTFRVSHTGLLTVRVSKSTGDLICAYPDKDKHVLVLLKINYDRLVTGDVDGDPSMPIDLDGSAVGRGYTALINTENGDQESNEDSNESDITQESNEDGNENGITQESNEDANENGITQDTNEQGISLGGNDDLPLGNSPHTLIISNDVICHLPSRVDVFATDADLNCVAFSVGKTAMVINLALHKILFFESVASVSSITFYDANNFAVGDSKGRITVYAVDVSQNTTSNEGIMACDLPSGQFELSPANFKKILLRYHSAVTRDGIDADFQNFRKVATSTNTLIWHAHGVNCLAYNSDGTMLLSGGEEGVLVVWHLSTGAKKFLTRLGSAIFHVLCQKAHGQYILSCEANEILFVDPVALVIRARITGLAVPISVGMKVDKDVNHVPATQEPLSQQKVDHCYNAISRPNVAMIGGYVPSVPLVEHWPTGVSNQCDPRVMGGNVAVYTRSNKLQKYNYIQDRETGSIVLKNANILSRQDDDFGEDWELESLGISTDGRVVVTVQSRNILTASSDDEEDNKQLLEEFEHDVMRNHRKGLLKFWVYTSNGNGQMEYVEQTKVSSPHQHKTTSIRQIENSYTFVTTSFDTEFKIWHVVRKRVIKSDNVFSAYHTVDVQELDRDVNFNDISSFMWVCVTTGSYKNMPCYGCAMSLETQLLAISHDTVVTFWKTDATHSSVDLVATMPLMEQDDMELVEPQEMDPINRHHLIEFVYPDQPRFIIHSNRSRLAIIDVSNGKSVWSYDRRPGQTIDKVIYRPELFNILIIATTTMDPDANEIHGLLEMFWFERGDESILVQRIYADHREMSRLVVSMCLTPTPVSRPDGGTKRDKTGVAIPAFDSSSMFSTLVVLTSNFTLETLVLESSPFSHQQPLVKSMRTKKALATRIKTTPAQIHKPLDGFGAFIESLLAPPMKPRKRVKQNLAESLCKSTEWQYRVRHPMPNNMVSALVDSGCPTCALPPPNVVLNRLSQIVTVRHLKQH
ncbi:WD G-beta repeat containing protein 75, putative [Babesia ovis]|uniref:WD G-beta repeat containing protein 75, putative n=1 Tax=Babesia ovis TaxID=5869 RepID=A0A9W5WUC2_BABOV|nr:WD G-beta repeat containing protein 75, putative [Babesia ovis]